MCQALEGTAVYDRLRAFNAADVDVWLWLWRPVLTFFNGAINESINLIIFILFILFYLKRCC
jgi:hypothetical protein